jgi:hypothetical protein
VIEIKEWTPNISPTGPDGGGSSIADWLIYAGSIALWVIIIGGMAAGLARIFHLF